MLDVKMTDVKLTDQCAGHEIAGHVSKVTLNFFCDICGIVILFIHFCMCNIEE